jgi:hypothetical protein
MGNAIVQRIYRRDGTRALNQARQQRGLPPLRLPFQQYDAAVRVLIMTSLAFDYRPRSFPSNVRYVGMPFEDTGTATWEFPWPSEDDRPVC